VRPQPTEPAEGRRPGWAAGARRTRLLAAAAVSLVILLVLLASSSGAPRESALVTPGPDTVSVIDATQGVVTGVVSGLVRPTGLAYGAGAAWVTDSSHDFLLRVNSAH